MEAIIRFFKVAFKAIKFQVTRVKVLYWFIAATYLAVLGDSLGMTMPIFLPVLLAIATLPIKDKGRYDWWNYGGILLAGLLIQLF